jgi:hypothetical protein
MESYKNKYLKYKSKYINLKNIINQIGGSSFTDIKQNDIIRVILCFTWNIYKYMGKVSKDGSEKHHFEKQEDDGEGEGPAHLYRDSLQSLLIELDDIRKQDNSIFDEFLPDIKKFTDLQHFKFNKYKYPNAVLVPIEEIRQGRSDESLSAHRKGALEKIAEDPNSLVPPISIDKQKNILDGNHRYFISKKFGFKLIPVIYK